MSNISYNYERNLWIIVFWPVCDLHAFETFEIGGGECDEVWIGEVPHLHCPAQSRKGKKGSISFALYVWWPKPNRFICLLKGVYGTKEDLDD
jgi:hypothetical protein